ncbi:MAG: UDP-N-acetylmuramoyl-L-alanine--D-glutamate ligase [Kiritimatiellales bacterium]
MNMRKYKTALVLGTGRSGKAAAELLRAETCDVVCIDQELTPEYRFTALPFTPDVAIVSPGFPLDHVWLKELIENGVPLLSEIELGWSRRQCPVIAVTGSNGKSSVVKWIAETIAVNGQKPVVCGNYGFPVCAAVMAPETPDWLVMEVSSFQLETIRSFRPEIGVLLNVLPNHLDRHGDMECYRRMKLRLFDRMIAGDTALIPFELLPYVPDDSPAMWKTFGREEGADFVYANHHAGEINVSGTWFDNPVLGVAAAAVAGVCEACGIPVHAAKAAAHSFEPLPHRVQLIAEIDGVKFIDDSKATNLAAMCAAVQLFPGAVHLIAGGRAKENDFSFAKDLLAQRVKRLYLIGEASSTMEATWQDAVECLPCGTLEQAVREAWVRAEAGDTVLLSPACTSFDQFSSFEERGDCFNAAVRTLSRKGDRNE